MTNSDPVFSVVVPVYNRAHSIGPTLKSVQDQTFSEFECLVIDDGSTDGHALEQAVAALDDPRFRLIRQENGGPAAARNAGIKAAKGKYVAFLDSDDLFLSQKLERFAGRMGDDPNQAGYSCLYVDRGVGKYWIRPDRPIRADEDMGEYLFVANQFVATPSLVLHRSAAAATLFDSALPKGEDPDFCLRLYRDGVRFFMIEEPLSVWVDVAESDRASRASGYEELLAWLKRSEALLTRRARLGYRATVLAYYIGWSRPLTVLKDLLVGWLVAGVPLRVTLRQLARAFLPRRAYRRLVDGFVAIRGMPSRAGKMT
jgi:glycosyltransferase involved in cell wall biosynthesis